MSVYKLIALVNPEIAILRLLKDKPDGMNIIAIKKEVDISIKKTKQILEDLYTRAKLNKYKVGASMVYYIEFRKNG